MADFKYNPSDPFYDPEDDPEAWRAAIYRKRGQQRERVRWYVQQRGWKVEGEYFDCGDGTALDRLLSEKGRFDAVVFPSLAAAGTDARQVLLTLDRIQTAGLEFVSVREHIDSLESTSVTDLVKATAKLERRKPTGRPRVKVDMARLQDMHSRGFSLRQMARLLKVSKSTVERLLKALPQHPPQALGYWLT